MVYPDKGSPLYDNPRLNANRYLISISVFLVVLLLCVKPCLAASPTVGTITPSNGVSQPNQTVIFTTTYSDADGWQNIQYVEVLFNTRIDFANCFYGKYDQNTNQLYLQDDAGRTWLGGFGFSPGSNNIIENSYARIDCLQTRVSGSGNTLTVIWNVTFKLPFISTQIKNIYIRVKDDVGYYNNDAFKKVGTWSVPNNTPSTGTIIPSEGTSTPGQTVNFTTTYSDLDTWQHIQYAELLFNATTSYTNCFYGRYDQNTNKLYLKDNRGGIWLGGYAPGSNNVIENSYAKLNCASTVISGSENTLTVIWSITFKTPFTGTKNAYLYVIDDVNAYAGWTQKGTWTIPNNPPLVGAVTPQEGTSISEQAVIFTTTYSDLDTTLNIQAAYFLINATADGANCFYGYYNQNTNLLYLRDDANAAWLGGYQPGASRTIYNSYAKLNCQTAIVSKNGATLTIKWPVTFKSDFAGVKNTYLYVKDLAGASDGWTKKGDFCIFRKPIEPQN